METVNGKVVDDLNKANRFINTGLNIVSARLVHETASSDAQNLSSYKLFEYGVAQNCIPMLSKECKDAIEGSLKLIEAEELRKLCEMPADAVVLDNS